MTATRTLLALATLLGCATIATAATPPRLAETVPEFPAVGAAGWLNSPPLRLADLRGKVVLVEFWTYGCSNCRNTLPWLKQAAERHRDAGLVVVAVHTPEFPAERERDNVVRALRQLGITYPVLLDPDSTYWNALGNRYWPAFWLIDRDGRLAATAIGELHSGDARTQRFEGRLRELLAAERATPPPPGPARGAAASRQP